MRARSLRITAGELKGRVIMAPPSVRATGGKVRQALFNILGSFITGARVLDGYAGSGALGCEALSRGAAFVAFVDADAEAVIAVRDNLARMGEAVPRTAWRIVHAQMSRAARELARVEAPFDVIILDPPYRTDEAKNALNLVVDYAILAATGLVAIEHDRRTLLPPDTGSLRRVKQHRYGATVLSLYEGRT
ncbi:MAG TPA: 16S rRNA (guanine(966)-N(2))-methyltransferase RsmD [bacterium]